MPEREQQRLLRAALEREANAQRLLIEGDRAAAALAYREVAQLYRRSWEAAHPGAFGRLIGYLKAAILAGDAKRAARFVRAELGDSATSPASAYALALAALATDEDELAARAVDAMREDSPAFELAADAIAAIARRDASGYARAVEAIVADFASRAEHLTGVAIADTAVVLERLAAARGLVANLVSPLLPPAEPGSPTRWLVDGMNVIGAGAGGWWRDREAAVRELTGRLAEFARLAGEPVAVVFDGREPAEGLSASGVEVAFAPGGRGSADDAIAARVAAEPGPEGLRVVTSDRELTRRVRAAGADVLGAGAFRRLLDETAGRGEDRGC
jgi:predicted RNA-binding protein with PIN domain